ncbi:MAG: hypothetical protein KGN77_01910 [Xanthomonadaceae bacterium]|nr:hypothetical protein [Xanthomonadaceae bacterium]
MSAREGVLALFHRHRERVAEMTRQQYPAAGIAAALDIEPHAVREIQAMMGVADHQAAAR